MSGALEALADAEIASVAAFVLAVFVVTALINPVQFAAIQLVEG